MRWSQNDTKSCTLRMAVRGEDRMDHRLIFEEMCEFNIGLD